MLVETWPVQLLRTAVDIKPVYKCKDIKKLIEVCCIDLNEHRNIQFNLEILFWFRQKFAGFCIQSEINKETFQTVYFKIIQQQIIM